MDRVPGEEVEDEEDEKGMEITSGVLALCFHFTLYIDNLFLLLPFLFPTIQSLLPEHEDRYQPKSKYVFRG